MRVKPYIRQGASSDFELVICNTEGVESVTPLTHLDMLQVFHQATPFAATAFQKLKRQTTMRESKIEKTICDFAKARGWKARKYKTENDRSAPDRIFLRRGVAIFIEFKAKGKKPTKAQWKKIKELRTLGFIATYIDNIEDGKHFFRSQDL